MYQYATKVKSVLYTIQPGDATMYTFMISVATKGDTDTKEFSTQETLLLKSDVGSLMHERVTSELQMPTLLPSDHFSGYAKYEKIYMVSLFSPSPTAFTISENMLKTLYSHRGGLVPYLRSHLNGVNEFTMYVVLAFLSIMKGRTSLPSVRQMQSALIEAKKVSKRLEVMEA